MVDDLFPENPERMVQGVVRPIFALVSTFEELAAVLKDGELDWAERAPWKIRGIDEQ